MLTLKVYNQKGEDAGTVEVDPADFGGEVNQQLLHDAVLMYLANRRAGTHSTKRRGEVAGSSKKLFRQKGTGRARRGTRRNNKVVGGGTVKGPKPRDYSYRMPKRMVKMATRMALLSKFQDDETVVLDELKLDEIKTKPVVEMLKALELEGKTMVLATADYDTTVYKSARNIPGVNVLPASQLNTYALLEGKHLVITKDALEQLKSGETNGASDAGSTESASEE